MKRNKILGLLSIISFLLCLPSCSSDEEKDSQPGSEYLNVEKNVAFTATETNGTIKIKADCRWDVASVESANWQDLKITPLSGDGNGVIVITSEQNHTSSDRIAVLTLVTKSGLKQKVTINQTRSGADLSINQNEFAFDDTEGQQILVVDCNTNWEILGTTGVDWLELGQTSGGAGIVEVPIKVKEIFDDSARSVQLVVSAGSLGDNKFDVSVTQKGKPFIQLEVTPVEMPVFKAAGETLNLRITSNGAWQVAIPSGSQQWIQAQPSSGIGNGEVKVTCQTNNSADERMSVLVVTAGTQNPQKRNIVVQQSGKK